MTTPARFTQSDISRAMKGARQAGFSSVRVEIDKDGRIIVHADDLAKVDPTDWRSKQPLYSDN